MSRSPFKDPANPSRDELAIWAAAPGGSLPMQDWELIIAGSPELDEITLELASNPKGKKRMFFLRVLYLIVGTAVQYKWSTRTQKATESLINAGRSLSDHRIGLWVSRCDALLANPESLDKKLWLDGNFARKGE